MKNFLKLIVPLLLLTSGFAQSETMGAHNIITGTGTVYRVIDGDTLTVNISSQRDYKRLKSTAKNRGELKYFKDKYRSFRIRVANVNTDESVHPDKKRNTQSGVKSSDFAKKYLNGKKVKYSCWDYGKWGRAICSIEVGGKDFGLALVESGHSKYVTKYGKPPYLHREYRKAG